jgi:hypothetical protein
MISLTLLGLSLALATSPAAAQTDLYDNGPINGTTNAWQINFGFVASNTFTIGSGGATVDGLVFGAWLFPQDGSLQQAEVSLTSEEFGGTTYFDQLVTFTESNCSLNPFGLNVCLETASFSPINLAAGTYWLNLQNAATQFGGDSPIYWDENSGPSQASESSVGTIPSEAFTLLGSNGTSTASGTTPEPSGLMLFGSGVLGLSGMLRRKLF